MAKYGGPVLAGLGAILATLPTDTYADIGGADEWIDAMFGTPVERTAGDLKRRDEKHYGYVGQFSATSSRASRTCCSPEGSANKVKGDWGKLSRIGQGRVTAVFDEFYTQYYPHEHTDQPPYVWTRASGPSTRAGTARASASAA